MAATSLANQLAVASQSANQFVVAKLSNLAVHQNKACFSVCSLRSTVATLAASQFVSLSADVSQFANQFAVAKLSTLAATAHLAAIVL